MEFDSYIIAYDIANPKRLNKIAKFLEGYLRRVQKSVFQGKLTGSQLVEVRDGINDIMQLVCYAMMIEERYGDPVTTGIIIYAGSRKRYDIKILGYHERQLYRLLKSMRSIRHGGGIPPRTKNKNRCNGCSINARCLVGT